MARCEQVLVHVVDTHLVENYALSGVLLGVYDYFVCTLLLSTALNVSKISSLKFYDCALTASCRSS